MNAAHRRIAESVAVVAIPAVALLAGCARPPVPRTALDDAPARIVGAFFGLDHAMPEGSRLLCFGGAGEDGLPVTFSRRVRASELSERAFTVFTRAGVARRPRCATLAPADGPAKRHTVLLVGELGSEPDDPPVRVEITGSLPLDDGADARGLSAPVIPLADGPTLLLAFAHRSGELRSDCPASSAQILVVVWAGGVRPGPALDQEAHRRAYRVTTGAGEVTPFALGDVGDRDNYVHLCLDVAAKATSVAARAGVLVDPRGDANPETRVDVAGVAGARR